MKMTSPSPGTPRDVDEGIEMENEQDMYLFGPESEEEDAVPHAEEFDEDIEALFESDGTRPSPGGAQRESKSMKSEF